MRGSKHSAILKQIGIKVTDETRTRLEAELVRRKVTNAAVTMSDLAREFLTDGLDRLDAARSRGAKTGT